MNWLEVDVFPLATEIDRVDKKLDMLIDHLGLTFEDIPERVERTPASVRFVPKDAVSETD